MWDDCSYVLHTQTSLMLSWLQRLELVETKNKTNVDWAQPDGRQIEQVGRTVFIWGTVASHQSAGRDILGNLRVKFGAGGQPAWTNFLQDVFIFYPWEFSLLPTASHHYQGKHSEKDCWINNSRKHFSDDEEELQEIAGTKILYCCKKIGMKGNGFFLPEFVFTFNWEIAQGCLSPQNMIQPGCFTEVCWSI